MPSLSPINANDTLNRQTTEAALFRLVRMLARQAAREEIYAETEDHLLRLCHDAPPRQAERQRRSKAGRQ